MTTFLIQSDDNGLPIEDFCFETIKAIRYQNWKNPNNATLDYNLITSSELLQLGSQEKVCIPVGSIEFVLKFIEIFYPNLELPKPRNIPPELMGYTHRNVSLFKDPTFTLGRPMFIKNLDRFKPKVCGVYDKGIVFSEKGNFLVSEVIEMESEYRAFIFKGNIVGLKNYNGNFLDFPSVHSISNMIDDIQCDMDNPPPAYTIDVASCGYNTAIVEMHDFFAVGFYGFSDYEKIPFMWSQWFNWFLRTAKKKD